MRRLLAPALAAAAALAALLTAGTRGQASPARSRGRRSSPREVQWKKTVIDTQFRSEGVAVADVNRDGKRDILAGNVWYEAPDWKMHEIRPVQKFEPATGYSNCFLCFASDVDHDGWVDEIVVGFPGAKASWFRNPGRGGGAWIEYPITDSACNESPNWADVDGDGHPELVSPYQEKQMAYYRPGTHPEHGWEQHLVGQPQQAGCQRFSHGLGVGDINGDGHPDILCTDGFWLGPSDPAHGQWKWVPAKLGPPCAQMHVYDFNGDGLPDVITSSAHQIGIWWYEQVRGPNGPEFIQHPIDNSFSESHSLVMADLNGDGQPDFVTGKRWWAHGPNGDINPNDPAVLYWYEFRRHGRDVEWISHKIDDDSGVGTQFQVTDVNGDGKPDIAISNKKGVFLFTQQ